MYRVYEFYPYIAKGVGGVLFEVTSLGYLQGIEIGAFLDPSRIAAAILARGETERRSGKQYQAT
jgi:hypothetical protein